MLELSTPVQYVKGVGPRIAEMLAAKGIHTVGDLLYYLPFRYEDRLNPRGISELRPGDVIRFDEHFDEPVLLAVSDQAQAWAIPGRVGDRVALRLVTPLVPMEA